jgi:hypothetical protein
MQGEMSVLGLFEVFVGGDRDLDRGSENLKFMTCESMLVF